MNHIPWKAISFILLISIVVIGALLFIIYEKESQIATTRNNFTFFIFLNTTLNSASALCIIAGKWAINKKKFTLHKRFMVSAFAFSSLFLISYIYYHYHQGNTPFLGQGWIKPFYFIILISHLILATITLPLVVITFYFAFSARFNLHKSIAIYTIYAWLYVSITGIFIYLLLQLYH